MKKTNTPNYKLLIYISILFMGLFGMFKVIDSSFPNHAIEKRHSTTYTPEPSQLTQNASLTKIEPSNALKLRRQAIKNNLTRFVEFKKGASQNAADAPSFNNTDYDVTIVTFFDYACSYCKKMTVTFDKLVAEDKKVRIIYRELPILSEISLEASKVALSINKIDPTKYHDFHTRLMKEGALYPEGLMLLAKDLGIEEAQINTLKETPEITKLIENNLNLAVDAGIKGLPAFAVEDQLISGAVSLDNLKSLVQIARGSKPNPQL